MKKKFTKKQACADGGIISPYLGIGLGLLDNVFSNINNKKRADSAMEISLRNMQGNYSQAIPQYNPMQNIFADGGINEPDFIKEHLGYNPFKGESAPLPQMQVPTQDATANLNVPNFERVKEFMGIMPEAKSADLFQKYMTHQQGAQGYKNLMKGNITPELKSNMKSNMPSNLHSDNVEKLVANFKNYWNQKLSKPVSKTIDPKVKEGIVKAATEAGEDPNTWLKISEIESAGGKNTHRSGSKYHGIFQIDSSYVNNKKDLYDPYKSTLAAIALSKNKWSKDSKLQYRDGGMLPP